jgi:5'-methylthioadenosine phosphorylase
MDERADIAIIGGTATIDSASLGNVKEVSIDTPYGEPSDSITLGELEGVRVAILRRHGKGHTIAPHLINFRANIDALHQLGVKRVLATATVGSLQEDYRAGDVVIVDQFIDWGKQVHSFVDVGKVYHISLADPFCPEMRETLISVTRKLDLRFHEKGTYVKIDGPQFSTRAASRMYRQFGDVVGMTSVPEAILAMERGMCPAIVATVTDYDCWAETPVIFDEVRRVMGENLENKKRILMEAVKALPRTRSCRCRDSLKGAEA